MGILKKAADLLSPSDPELVTKTLARLDEQDKWNDVFSTRLIQLLDNVDAIKAETRKSIRTTEQLGVEARSSLEKATFSFRDSHQNLSLTVRWAVSAAALSWICTAWVLWFHFQAAVPLWAACVVTVIIVAGAYTITKRTALES